MRQSTEIRPRISNSPFSPNHATRRVFLSSLYLSFDAPTRASKFSIKMRPPCNATTHAEQAFVTFYIHRFCSRSKHEESDLVSLRYPLKAIRVVVNPWRGGEDLRGATNELKFDSRAFDDRSIGLDDRIIISWYVWDKKSVNVSKLMQFIVFSSN